MKIFYQQQQKQQQQQQQQQQQHNSNFFLLLPSLILVAVIISIFCYMPDNHLIANAAYMRASPSAGGPILKDPSLKVEKVFQGLRLPTSMAFLGPDDILVLEKNKGIVDRIANGKMVPQPLLKVPNIGRQVEWGMLGVAVDNNSNNNINNNSNGGSPPFVFLFYTENQTSAGPTRNHLYRYELSEDKSKLVNPKLLLDLPATSPTPGGENNHDGGKVVISPEHNVYTVIGDVGAHNGIAQNNEDGQELDGTSGVLRNTEDGQLVLPDPLGDDDPTKVYYAYGIRNSFGIDFDPVTGNLWDTENGASDNDEINIVEPGFNSGWGKVMGFAPDNFNANKELVTFDGKGKYHNPQFVWKQTVGPTALKFLNSNRLGKQYENTIFVGDVNTGNLYNFRLDADREGLLLGGALADKIAETHEELQPVIFGQGFGVITDIGVGPTDGYMYILTYDGSIYRVSPK